MKVWLVSAGVLVACLAAGTAVAAAAHVGDGGGDATARNVLAGRGVLVSSPAGHATDYRPPRRPPAPIGGLGYAKRFDNEFNVFNRRIWAKREWWEERPPPNSIYVRDGVLHVVSRRAQGYPDVTVSSEPHGRRTGRSFLHGYFEARLRWTKGHGSWPAFWLLSTTHATNPRWPAPACQKPTCLSAEIDAFEGQGSQPNVFYGTVHRNSCECYEVPDRQNRDNDHRLGVDLTAGFHVYGMLWTNAEIRWYLDGRFTGRAPVFDSTNQPMHLLLDMWSGGWTRETDGTTPEELHTEVDWVRVWQK